VTTRCHVAGACSHNYGKERETSLHGMSVVSSTCRRISNKHGGGGIGICSSQSTVTQDLYSIILPPAIRNHALRKTWRIASAGAPIASKKAEGSIMKGGNIWACWAWRCLRGDCLYAFCTWPAATHTTCLLPTLQPSATSAALPMPATTHTFTHLPHCTTTLPPPPANICRDDARIPANNAQTPIATT